MMADALDSRVRHRRSIESLLGAATRSENYRSVFKAFQLCETPVDMLSRYVRNGGAYPASLRMRTPLGPIEIETYTPDDVQTINEIFLRGDYDTPLPAAEVVVDFGSNIGISALYFLTRTASAYVYCYEPLPMNTERLRRNLRRFEGRLSLQETAIGETNGKVSFGWEPTGRYGGVGRNTGQTIEVPCLDSNEVLRGVIERHGRIDLLKVDVETLEKIVVERIPDDLRPKIRDLVVEYPFAENPLAATHDWDRRNYVTAFHRRSEARVQ
jgi:FkbM family methyltransferase